MMLFHLIGARRNLRRLGNQLEVRVYHFFSHFSTIPRFRFWFVLPPKFMAANIARVAASHPLSKEDLRLFINENRNYNTFGYNIPLEIRVESPIDNGWILESNPEHATQQPRDC